MKNAHTYLVTCPKCKNTRTIHNIKFDRDIKKRTVWTMDCKGCNQRVLITIGNIEDITYNTTW